MPHTLFNSKKILLDTPFSSNGVSFTLIAKSYNFINVKREIEYKVGVKTQDKEFLLTLKPKGENFLLKADKTTRVTPVGIIKNAINTYIKAIDANILFSNTNDNSLFKVEEEQKEYLKEIDFFVNEFETTKQIELEIGFGSGRHLLYQAKQNPNIQYIGLEIHTPSIEQLLKQIKLQNIKNILVINYDARLFMEFLKSNSVNKIFVHFPVPWEKKPHRRVYSSEFINEALRVLDVDGTLELRTDSKEYFDYSLELLFDLPKDKVIIDIDKDLKISSKYEDRWKKEGKTIYDVVLKSFEKSPQKECKKNFSFEKIIDIEKFKQNIPQKAIVGENFVIHFEDIFIFNKNSGLIQLTLGSFNKPLNKYLYVENGKISYFQAEPIPTSANIDAHNRLKEILKND